MSHTAFFGTIYGSHYTVQLTLSILLSIKSFQFQLNKLFSNGHLINRTWQAHVFLYFMREMLNE